MESLDEPMDIERLGLAEMQAKLPLGGNYQDTWPPVLMKPRRHSSIMN
jgi:hypothetical protein